MIDPDEAIKAARSAHGRLSASKLAPHRSQGSGERGADQPGPFAPGFLLTHHGGRVGRLRHYPIALELARLQRKAEAGQAPPPLIPPANAVKEVRK
jgi:hypothetical protein